jgi:hypothetical protein
MDEGFVLDQAHNFNAQSKWIEGPPTKSFWTGIKMKGRAVIPVTTYRCSKCGYLESFAQSGT